MESSCSPAEWIVQIMTGPHYTLTVTFAAAAADAVCVTDSCERERRKESAKGGGDGGDGGAIEKKSCMRFVNSPMIV